MPHSCFSCFQGVELRFGQGWFLTGFRTETACLNNIIYDIFWDYFVAIRSVLGEYHRNCDPGKDQVKKKGCHHSILF